MKTKFAKIIVGMAIFASAAVGAAEEPDMPGVAPEPAGGWKTKMICISAPASKDVGRFCAFVKDTLKPAGIEAVVLLVRYKYKFTSHPECATKDAISRSQRRLVDGIVQAHSCAGVSPWNRVGREKCAP